MCGKDEMLRDLREAERTEHLRQELEHDVVLRARRYVREGARLAATDPFEDALVAAVERLESWIAGELRMDLKSVRAMHDTARFVAGTPTPAGPSGEGGHG